MALDHPERSRFSRTFQWGKAIYAGLIAGGIFLLVPAGSPWSSDWIPRVMGRLLPTTETAANETVFVAILLHLALSLIYACVIALVVTRMNTALAIIIGGLLGLGFYFLDRPLLFVLYPGVASGEEVRTVFTHIVFGMVASGAYKGLSRRPSEVAET